jgi:hypothetical protein
MAEKLIIDRDKWLRGEGAEHSYLIRPTDCKQCCLGFDLLRRGFTVTELTGNKMPTDVASSEDQADRLQGLVERCCGCHWDSSELANQLMLVNDSRERDQQEREQEIARLFAEIGVDVEFVN